MRNKTYYISGKEQTDSFVIKLAKFITPGTIILLNGDIGTGKTYICSKIAENYGISNLSSSSFQRVSLHTGDINIVHCDFYRSTFDYNFFCEEIEPLLYDPWILLLEWVKREDNFPEIGQLLEIQISEKGGNNREIVFIKN